ncbi:hypothetical protein KBZ10_06685 [Streptomyces sp. F63]|uniref:AMIN-like domain-containing (lipo)protein n=1 Tax=Streptomyces sp. F63 TaxID=2824887 RepID=UPI001B36B641|nr:hypothetical protein [Streptomyces sp. F63]MBQ0984215.1 hypothetical protein [Streptomyces sp. F63]
MRRLSSTLAVLILAVAGLAAATAPAAGAAPAAAEECAVTWGSTVKARWDSDYKPLVGIRSGRHDCYDRLVFDVDGTAADEIGYYVHYVSQLRQDGSGDLVPVKGGAILEVVAFAPAYDPETMEPTLPETEVNVDGYRTFRDVVVAGSFEGQTQVGLGVRARLPFRVFRTANHLVVDVAHTW